MDRAEPPCRDVPAIHSPNALLMPHVPDLLNPRPLGPVVLGIALSGKAVGMATVASGDRLREFHVRHLNKLTSREGKEARFRQLVRNETERHGVTHIALVELKRQERHRDLIDALISWLMSEASNIGVSLVRLPCEASDDTAQNKATRPKNREIAEVMARRFVELARIAPSADPVPGEKHLGPGAPGVRRRLRSDRERYWMPMFRAVHAAVQVHDRTLLS